MHLLHAPVILSIALVIGACGNTTSRDSTSASLKGSGGNDLVVVLSKAEGSVGGVVVRSGASDAVVLDKPYAAARIEGVGRVQRIPYDAELAKKEFGGSLAALPARPTIFRVYFLEGKDELTPDSEREVELIFADIAWRPDPDISVIGHTDAIGTRQYNDQLSLQRAQRVREDLTRRGVPGKYIAIAGRGKREPVVRNAADTPEPMNRRVEIIVR